MSEEAGTLKKKFFSKRSCDQPRQEPGRYFGLVVVPSAEAPQRQPNRPDPELVPHNAPPALVESGVSDTTVLFTAAAIPWTVAVTRPLSSLEMPAIFFSSRRRHTRWNCDWSSDVCSSD